jgi:uncharacterized protein YndB with AHSA1/START domain
MNKPSTDRIDKQILLHAPRSRVWRALTDAEEFGSWFRVKLEGPFVPGGRTAGNLTYPGYERVRMEVQVEVIEAQVLFSFRWHPYAIDPNVNYSIEPTTLVEFRLDSVNDGTLLTVIESGFDRLPSGRRDEAFRMNSGGWAQQLVNIEQYVAS